jgi:hypothetical protein
LLVVSLKVLFGFSWLEGEEDDFFYLVHFMPIDFAYTFAQFDKQQKMFFEDWKDAHQSRADNFVVSILRKRFIVIFITKQLPS